VSPTRAPASRPSCASGSSFFTTCVITAHQARDRRARRTGRRRIRARAAAGGAALGGASCAGLGTPCRPASSRELASSWASSAAKKLAPDYHGARGGRLEAAPSPLAAGRSGWPASPVANAKIRRGGGLPAPPAEPAAAARRAQLGGSGGLLWPRAAAARRTDSRGSSGYGFLRWQRAGSRSASSAPARPRAAPIPRQSKRRRDRPLTGVRRSPTTGD
jgi:hypothetical protein